jgi:hypothetical protein
MKLRDGMGGELAKEDVLGWAPRGWRPIVGRLIDDLGQLQWNGVVLQVKEKFGGLRFYVDQHRPEIDSRIDQAEMESEQTCQVCGEPGTQSEIRYWISTLCEDHAEAVRAGKAAWEVAKELDDASDAQPR